MPDFFAGLFPLISFFFLGILLNALKLFKKEDGLIFLKLVFYLFIPAMALRAVLSLEINKDIFILPLIPIVPILVTFLLAAVFLKFCPLQKPVAGIFYTASMNMNTAFILPFITVAYGSSALAKAIFFDIGNIFFIFTFIYLIAVKHGKNKVVSKRFILKKILCVPTIWALIIGSILLMLQVKVSDIFMNFLNIASHSSTPLIMLSLGIVFTFKQTNLSKAFAVIFIRMTCGLLIGIAITKLLPIDELSKKVIIIACSAPCGFNTMVFAAMENLDDRFGATVCSISTFLGIFILPLIIWFLAP